MSIIIKIVAYSACTKTNLRPRFRGVFLCLEIVDSVTVKIIIYLHVF
nr:MAG TPA_asm: hypothetical protein [Caudoviricetes sp.]